MLLEDTLKVASLASLTLCLTIVRADAAHLCCSAYCARTRPSLDLRLGRPGVLYVRRGGGTRDRGIPLLFHVHAGREVRITNLKSGDVGGRGENGY